MSFSGRSVVMVDGVRTPFGRAGAKGIYAETRADDLVVRVIRELVRRNPNSQRSGSTRSRLPRQRRSETRD